VVTLLRRSAIAFAALGVIGGIVYAALPTRVAVDMAQVQAGSLEVTVREEGKTRIRERYVVSSPLAGRVLRISLDPGDEVAANETVLATIEPADPSLLDARSVAQSQAKVQASEAARHRAEADLKRSEASFERAKSNFQRVQSLRESRAASTEQLEDADLELTAASEQLAAARFNVNIAEFEWQQARAALTHFQPGETADPTQDWRMQVRSPISGRVLRVYQESAAVLVAGTPLVEVGDSSDLEVVVDVLSEDAVRVTPGDAVRIEQWGGGRSLPGRVRLVEP
jgi:HlyD family secretion protein